MTDISREAVADMAFMLRQMVAGEYETRLHGTVAMMLSLRAAIDAAEAAKARMVEALDEANALKECACGHDSPNDICMGHIAILNRVRVDHPAFARAVDAERERCAAKVERDQGPTFGDSRRIAAAIRNQGEPK